jgi:mannan endo-1,6-alpha-mannosidase
MLLIFITAALAIDINSKNEVKAATKNIADKLMTFYVDQVTAYNGALISTGDYTANDTQWWESGVMWGAVMEYTSLSRDSSYVSVAIDALVKASKGNFFFLGENAEISETLRGRWNDDIAWWAMGPLIGAELFGLETVMPSSQHTYQKVVQGTYDQMWSQWDEVCGGGIYWSRNRDQDGSGSKCKFII